MKVLSKIAVCSRTFSKHNLLKEELVKVFPNVKFNEGGKNLEGDSLIEFLEGADAAIVALEKITFEVVDRLPNLKVISKFGVGLDNIDFKALEHFKIKLVHTPGVNKRSVSELVLAYILNLYRKVEIHNTDLKNGIWKNQGGFQLTNKTIGIIGAGNVGQDLMNLLKPFSCNILFNDLVKMPSLESENIKQVSMDELLMNADVVTVHIPYNDHNNFFINKEKIQRMKKNSILINTSRGGIVDEEELYLSLSNNHLYGAAMDVFLEEPLKTHKLLTLTNFIGTPHVGGSSDESVLAMGRAAIGNLKNYGCGL